MNELKADTHMLKYDAQHDLIMVENGDERFNCDPFGEEWVKASDVADLESENKKHIDHAIDETAKCVKLGLELSTAKAENERLKESEGQLSRELGYTRDANAEDLAELTTELTTIKAVIGAVKRVACDTEELNMINYDHELVEQLNRGMIEISSLLDSTPNAMAVVEGSIGIGIGGVAIVQAKLPAPTDYPGKVTVVVLPRSGGK